MWRLPRQYRDMWVGVYNPSLTPLPVTVHFIVNATRRWSRNLTLAAYQRDAVPAQEVVPVVNGQFENFATEVEFTTPGTFGVVSFALWHSADYGSDRVVDLSQTTFCREPTPR